MDIAEIIKSFNGFIWEAIYAIKPENYIESDAEPNIAETILGPMTELEQALFTIKASLLVNILPFFNVNEDDDVEIGEFYEWIVSSPQVDFLDEYAKDKDEEEKLLIDEELALTLRVQFLAVNYFLEIVTSQRFVLFPEDVVINYRKGSVVTTMSRRLFNLEEN